jgi:hypothetical protein
MLKLLCLTLFFRGDVSAKLICGNSLFYNCKRLSFGFVTNIEDCIIRFNDIPTDMSASDDVEASAMCGTYPVASAVFNTFPGNGSVVKNCLIENTNESLVAGLVSEKDSPSSSNLRPYENSSVLFRGFDSFIGCSFKNLIGCVQRFTKIDMCNFVNCLYALLGDLSDYVLRYQGLDEEKREVEVANSIFEDCRDVINFVTSVTNCQFIGSNEEIIGSFDRSDGYNALSIEKCSFYNSRTKEKPIIEFKNKANHCLADCVFDGIDASELYKSLIDVGPSGGHLTVSSCTFANCATSDGNEIIKTEGGYYTGAFKKKYVPVELSEIKNCHGLENVNDGKNKVKDPPIQHKTKKGIEIGASIENEDVGVPGFDPTTA